MKKYEPLQDIDLDVVSAYTILPRRRQDDCVDQLQPHLKTHANHIAHNPKVKSTKEIH